MPTAPNHVLQCLSPSAPSLSYLRLHVTPLNESLIQAILPAAVLPKARNISYHTIKTFPENCYGFVDLPSVEAEKLKNKLNGAILKGKKIRIGNARPEGTPAPLGAAGNQANLSKVQRIKVERSMKKDARGEAGREAQEPRQKEGTLSGVELTGRTVKRGWSKAKGDYNARKPKEKKEYTSIKEKDKSERKRQLDSVYTDGPEMLFKTQLPPTAHAAESASKRQKKGHYRKAVIHEFENTTTFPTFVKAAPSIPRAKQTVEYVEGKGWIGEDGAIIEPAKSDKNLRLASLASGPKCSGEGKTGPEQEVPAKDQKEVQQEKKETSSSDETDTFTEESENSDGGHDPEGAQQPSSKKEDDDSTRPKFSGSAKALTIKIPSTPGSSKVHPLEALYKRRNTEETPGDAKECESAFTFFGDVPIEEIDEETKSPAAAAQLPLTPFSQQDFESRHMRSAAPTPDTVHPRRSSKFWSREGGMMDGNDDGGHGKAHFTADTLDAKHGDQVQHPEDWDGQSENRADFRETFYARRSELLRSWNSIRKAARKEKRYRDNLSRSYR